MWLTVCVCLEQAPQLSKTEIENLLKKGAYGAIMDEDDDANKWVIVIIAAWGFKGGIISKKSFNFIYCVVDVQVLWRGHWPDSREESSCDPAGVWGEGVHLLQGMLVSRQWEHVSMIMWLQASFAADGSSDITVDDPEFWQKWAAKANLDLEELANKVSV